MSQRGGPRRRDAKQTCCMYTICTVHGILVRSTMQQVRQLWKYEQFIGKSKIAKSHTYLAAFLLRIRKKGATFFSSSFSLHPFLLAANSDTRGGRDFSFLSFLLRPFPFPLPSAGN